MAHRKNPLGISWFWWLAAGAGAYVYFTRKKPAEVMQEQMQQVQQMQQQAKSMLPEGETLYTGVFSG